MFLPPLLDFFALRRICSSPLFLSAHSQRLGACERGCREQWHCAQRVQPSSSPGVLPGATRIRANIAWFMGFLAAADKDVADERPLRDGQVCLLTLQTASYYSQVAEGHQEQKRQPFAIFTRPGQRNISLLRSQLRETRGQRLGSRTAIVNPCCRRFLLSRTPSLTIADSCCYMTGFLAERL